MAPGEMGVVATPARLLDFGVPAGRIRPARYSECREVQQAYPDRSPEAARHSRVFRSSVRALRGNSGEGCHRQMDRHSSGAAPPSTSIKIFASVTSTPMTSGPRFVILQSWSVGGRTDPTKSPEVRPPWIRL